MNNSTLKKTSSLNPISSAPRRPEKLGSVQSIVRNETDKNGPSPFEEITLSDDDEVIPTKSVKCETCSRDMTQWMNSRRDIHTKVCKAKRAEKEKEKTTIKKSRTLTETIETDDKVLEKPSQDPREAYKEWELSKNNVKFARIAADDEENRKRKRPRSFAVVELAPKKCQCEVLTTLHSRFIDEFHCNSLKNQKKKEEGVTEHSFQMKKIIQKLSRYEQLSADMQKTLDDISEISTSLITINSSDGYHVKCHSLILKHRTSMLRMYPKTEIIPVEQTKEVLKAWLTFVFTANIEWSENEKEGVRELAVKYGPVGLITFMKEDEKTEKTIEEIDPPAVENELSLTPIRKDIKVATGIPESKKTQLEVTENTIEQEEPVNYFTSDDPLFGFGKTVENEDEEDVKIDAVVHENNARASVPSTPQKSKDNVTMDSFDEWSNQAPNEPSTSSSIITPVRNAPKPVFGSHVKILKTNDITPMPRFDTMDENELKERMKEIGMRPKGKKAMIQILKKAYTTLHPEVCIGTPTIRPLLRTEPLETMPENGEKVGKAAKPGLLKTKTLSERMITSPKKKDTSSKIASNDIDVVEEDSAADKTLNISNDEREVGKICGDDIGEDEDEDEEITSSNSTGKSDLSSLKLAFLTWLRSEQNSVLHEHILSLQPVSIEEMLIRLEKADGPLGRIGKGKLVRLLEMLKVTYQLPQKTGRARGGFKRRI